MGCPINNAIRPYFKATSHYQIKLSQKNINSIKCVSCLLVPSQLYPETKSKS